MKALPYVEATEQVCGYNVGMLKYLDPAYRDLTVGTSVLFLSAKMHGDLAL
jgi:hypothetical protein